MLPRAPIHMNIPNEHAHTNGAVQRNITHAQIEIFLTTFTINVEME